MDSQGRKAEVEPADQVAVIMLEPAAVNRRTISRGLMRQVILSPLASRVDHGGNGICVRVSQDRIPLPYTSTVGRAAYVKPEWADVKKYGNRTGGASSQSPV